MKIKDAHITFVKGDKPTKACMILERYDLVESCEIEGGEINKMDRKENTDILFESCTIVNCEYGIKEVKEGIPPCPIVVNCLIKNSKLPHTYYVGCYFKEKKREEGIMKVVRK